MKTTTTTYEYDESGRISKETVTESVSSDVRIRIEDQATLRWTPEGVREFVKALNREIRRGGTGIAS